jgi:uncharacterized protein
MRAGRCLIPTIFARTLVPRAAAALALALAFGTAGAVVALAAHVVRRVTKPTLRRRPATHVFTPWEYGVPFEQVEIPCGDLALDAWYMERDPNAPVVMVLAGHGGSKSDLLGISSYLYRAGFNCLLFDYRGVGASPGEVLTLGYRESTDAIAALESIEDRAPNVPIGVLGNSMGGSVAIKLAANDQRVGAVVVDSAFATQRKIVMHHVWRTIRARPEPVVGTANLILRRKHGFRLDDFEPLAEVGQIAPRPLLVIHATDDRVVPLAHGLELWRAAGEPKQFWLARGAGHCGGYFQDRETYCEKVAEFFQQSLCVEPGRASAESQR